MDKSNNDCQKLKQDLNDASDKISDLEVKNEYETREKNALQQQLDDANKRIAAQRADLLKAEQKVVETKMLYDVAQKDLQEKEDEVLGLLKDKKSLEKHLDTTKATMNQLQEDNNRLKSDQGRLQQEILDLKEKVKILTNKEHVRISKTMAHFINITK